MKYFETIILGGGISGLSCAQELKKTNKHFILISKNIGGRMKHDSTRNINFGAVYIYNLYNRVLPLVKKKRRLPVYTYTFFDGKSFTNYLHWRHLKYLPQVVKFSFILRKFTQHMRKAMPKFDSYSLDELLHSDSYLKKLWDMEAIDFIREQGIEDFDKSYGDPIVGATFFCRTRDLNAFTYLGTFFPLVLKAYEIDFRETIQKLTAGIDSHIKQLKLTIQQKELNHLKQLISKM